MKRRILPIACLTLAFGLSLAEEVRPGFDTKEVVRRVRKAQVTTDRRRDMTEIRQRISDRVPSGPGTAAAHDWGEFLLDTNVVCAPAPGDQDMPAIAFDGTDFFVVWHDERGGTYDIYGARVTAEGVVRDTSGIAVTTAVGDQLFPVVAFDGTNFLVAWQDERGDWCDIYAARVTSDGAVLDPSGIAVSTAAYDQVFPAVSFDGTSFLVVWQDERGGEFGDIYGARITGAGAVLDPTGIVICRVVYDQMFPAVGFNGTNWLVVWEDDRNGLGDIYGARVTGAGIVLDSLGIAVSIAADDQGGPGVTSDGSNLLVVWHDARSGGYYDIYGARVTQAGVVLDPTGIVISTAPDDQEWPAAAFDGTNLNVAWQDLREGMAGDIYCARVNTAGVVLDPSGIAVSRTAADQGYPRLAFASSSFLLVWQDDRDDSYSIYGARMSRDGVLLDSSGIALSTTTNDQWFPAIAFDGENFLVVWQDSRGGSDDIYGARVAPSGTILDSQAVPVCAATDIQHDPDLDFDGTNYLVVWEDSRNGGRNDIYGSRVTKAGDALDPSGIAICTAPSDQWEPNPVFGDTMFLVVWHEYRNGPGPDVYGARVTKAGTVLDPDGIAVCTAAGPQRYAAAAFDGTNFLVVWQDEGSSYDIRGARVNSAGVVLDPSGIAISSAAYDQQASAMAFDGNSFLVVWSDARSGVRTDIYGARVNSAGVVLDPTGIAICTADGDQWYPKLTFDGTNFLVVWTDSRAGSNTDIYGAKVTPGGVVADSFPVITSEGNQWSGDLTAAPGGQTLLAYGGWAGMVAGKNYNAYRVWGKLGPFPGMAEGQQPAPNDTRRMATIVRGVLFLPEAKGERREARSELLDATGRAVMSLRPGPNDVSPLPSGVYFVLVSGMTSIQKVMLVP